MAIMSDHRSNDVSLGTFLVKRLMALEIILCHATETINAEIQKDKHDRNLTYDRKYVFLINMHMIS